MQVITVKLSRREFLKKAELAGICGSALCLVHGEAAASESRPAADDGMGVLVDLTKCNGCRQCEAACQEAAGFEFPTNEELLDESVFLKHRRPGPRSYTTVNRHVGPDEERQETPVFVKANCFHCLDPACVSACLVGAMRRQPNGAVTYDAGKCMGCRYCMVACPFQIPTYEYDNILTPAVRKCTFCCDEANPNKGGTPACVRACAKQCLIYDKRRVLLAQAHDRIRRYSDRYVDHVYGEHEAGGTSWLYLSGIPFDELDFLNVCKIAPPRLSEAIQHGVFNYFIPPVAWACLLGLAMWSTRSEPEPRAAGRTGELEQYSQEDEAARTVGARRREGVPA